MPDHHADNPYAAPAPVNELRPQAASLPTDRAVDADTFAKNNIAGLVLTVLGSIALELMRTSFFRVFADFKLALPAITLPLGNGWLVYGAMLVFVAVFLLGIFTRPRKRSALIGMFGLMGLLVAALYVVIALFLPLISLMNSLT